VPVGVGVGRGVPAALRVGVGVAVLVGGGFFIGSIVGVVNSVEGTGVGIGVGVAVSVAQAANDETRANTNTAVTLHTVSTSRRETCSHYNADGVWPRSMGPFRGAVSDVAPVGKGAPLRSAPF
jgi:hypothetical protein